MQAYACTVWKYMMITYDLDICSYWIPNINIYIYIMSIILTNHGHNREYIWYHLIIQMFMS